MKIQLYALLALSCIAVFTACSDKGLDPQREIAAYDKLPRFCEEMDTVRLSTTGALFYCENGDWFEVGAVIPKPKSSSSVKAKSSSSSAKESSDSYEEESSSSEDIESSDGSSSSSSRKSRDSSSSESSSSSQKVSSSSSSSSKALVRDPEFSFLDGMVEWEAKSFTLKAGISEPFYEQRLADNGFFAADLNVLHSAFIPILSDSLKLGFNLTNFEGLYVKVSGGLTYYITTFHEYVGAMVGTYSGEYDDLIASIKALWPNNYIDGSLWSMDASVAYQVQTPEVVQCTGGHPMDLEDYGAECFATTGGWWFAFDASPYLPGTSVTFDPINDSDPNNPQLITTDYMTGDIADGSNLVENHGLQIKIMATGVSAEMPALGGIGFNWTKNEEPIDISNKNGFCLAYFWDGDIPMRMELSWNTMDYGDDTFYKELPAGIHVIDIPWSAFAKNGWDKMHSTTIATAIEYSLGIRFQLMNYTNQELGGTFRLATLGWYGECGAK
jgi:hypothetical protein